MHFCFCWVCFRFFSTKPRDWLGWTSPKWPILRRVGRKIFNQSINEYVFRLSIHCVCRFSGQILLPWYLVNSLSNFDETYREYSLDVHLLVYYKTVCRPIALTSVIFRLTPPSRPNKAGLKCPYVRPSTKRFFDFNEIWYVGRGRRLMHDGMQYGPIQGHGQGHKSLKVGNSTIVKGYLLPHLQWGLANDHRSLN